MNGKLLGSLLIGAGLIAGAAMYYLQVYAFYEPVELGPENADGFVAMGAVPLGGSEPVPIPIDGFSGIDSTSSPIRFRACFRVTDDAFDLGTFTPAEDPIPLNAPRWFSCFDAAQIGADLAEGRAAAILGEENVIYGIDRVLAIYPDGRGYAWHQINACGEVVFDGRPAPEGCPPPPAPGG